MSSLTAPLLASKPTPLDDLLALGPAAAREKATWIYKTLRDLLDVPVSRRTDRVRADGDLLPLGSPKQRALLALLLLHANAPLSRDRLIDELWGEARSSP